MTVRRLTGHAAGRARPVRILADRRRLGRGALAHPGLPLLDAAGDVRPGGGGRRRGHLVAHRGQRGLRGHGLHRALRHPPASRHLGHAGGHGHLGLRGGAPGRAAQPARGPLHPGPLVGRGLRGGAGHRRRHLAAGAALRLRLRPAGHGHRLHDGPDGREGAHRLAHPLGRHHLGHLHGAALHRADERPRAIAAVDRALDHGQLQRRDLVVLSPASGSSSSPARSS